LGKKGKSKEYVHIEYKEDKLIRTKKWIYTNNDDLIRVNKLGKPENKPEKEGSHKKTREELKNILAKIKQE